MRWPDGTPAVGAHVQFDLSGGTKLSLSQRAEVRWLKGREVYAAGIAEVSAAGQFAIPAADATEVTLRVTTVDRGHLIGEAPTHQVSAPATPQITLPFPVTVRAIQDGQLVPHARILIHGYPPHRAGRDGTSRLLLMTDASLRAEQGPARSPWQSLASNQLEQTIDMVMTNQLVELSVDFDGEIPLRNARFHWQCVDGRQATRDLTRDQDSGPFRLLLDPAKYLLRVSASEAEGNGKFLLPIKRAVNTRQTSELELTARFGGTFVLQVIDDRGRYVAGNCAVRGVDGKDLMLDLNVAGQPGAFAAETARCREILPPGPYALVIDLNGPTKHKRYMQIKPFETAAVVLRL